MLNEEKIRKMIRLSEYENGIGGTDLKRTHYTKTDYIRLQLLKTAVAVVVAGILACIVTALFFIDDLMLHLFEIPFREILIYIGLGLFVVELISLLITIRIANQKYIESSLRVREYDATLKELLLLYEEEGQEDRTL